MADATNVEISRKWGQMSFGERVLWWGKLLVALVTFGFVFPHIMEPHLKD